MENTISIRNVSHSFKERKTVLPVLNEINLELNHGDVIAILAPSGAGKSTLLKIIAGLLVPTEGEIWINGSSPQEAISKKMIAYAFQDAIVDTLLIKCRRALQQTGFSRLVVAGGVGANQRLRKELHQVMNELKGEVYFPKPEYCTDNGAMVAYAGCMHLLQGQRDSTLAIDVRPRWPLASCDA